jgi:molecular chaperone DnaJ
LSDPDRRRQYDVAGSGVHREPEAYGFEGFDFSVSVGGPSASTFGDLFAELLTPLARAEAGDPERGADLHQVIDLSFEAALQGGHHQITLTRHAHCRTCRGTGTQGTVDMECSLCHGSGAVKSARGHMVFSKPCPPCRGTGRRIGTRCRTCGGQQTDLRTETVVINVPPGLADGARIRIAGKGHAGRNGGAPGDLYITARVSSHPLFRREGDDLHLVVPVAVHEAALGARVEIPALEGRARLRVPPGTQSGQRFRLRERGVPSSRDGRRGDLVVEIRLVLPKVLDERSKELLREFGRLNADDVRKELAEQLPPVGEQAS